MDIFTIFIYFLLSLILFVIINLLDKKINNKIFIILISPVYIVIVSGILTNLDKSNLYLISVIEFFLRIFYYNKVIENNNSYLKIYSINMLFSYLINYYFINKIGNVFLSPEEFKIIFWIFTILFIYNLFKNNVNLKINLDYNNKEKNKEYIIVSYAKLKSKYYEVVNTIDKKYTNIIYTIMLYENKKRPKIFRYMDNLKFKFGNKKVLQGIMQVSSKKEIDDFDSVEIVIKKINSIIKKDKLNNMDILKLYYKNNLNNDIINIFSTIEDFDNL